MRQNLFKGWAFGWTSCFHFDLRIESQPLNLEKQNNSKVQLLRGFVTLVKFARLTIGVNAPVL